MTPFPLFFYELYFNDIDKLWLICQACNLHKSKNDSLRWLEHQWPYGKQFLDYIYKSSLSDEGILTKIANEKGLAQVTIEWFWNNHANYISNAQQFLQDTVVKIKILNKTIDHLLNFGEQEAAEELQQGLELRQGIINEVARMEGIDMPKAAKAIGAEPLQIRDEKGKLVEYTVKEYAEAKKDTIEETQYRITTRLQQKIREKQKMQQSPTYSGEKDPKKIKYT